MTAAAEIIVVVDGTGVAVDPVAYEMLAFANRLQNMTGTGVRLWLLLGKGSEAPAREIARKSGVDVTAFQCSDLPHYLGEAFRNILEPALREAAPAYVVTAHTSGGAEWAPAVAARLEAGCIGGIDGLGVADGRIWFSKDRLGGKVKGRFASDAALTVLTVQPGCFKFEGRPEGGATGRVTIKTIDWKPEQTRFSGVVPAPAGAANLKDATIIVAAGNGIGAEENLQWIHRLAERLPKAMVAGTRIVCDRGWLGYDRQVGVTGATVAPALYIACGISGASQHIMGMRGSGFVIAINTDAQAPICAESDVCIVEDITTFIPMVLDIYEKQMAQRNGG
jgi:electron transfer flavoprotein alpha subunit